MTVARSTHPAAPANPPVPSENHRTVQTARQDLRSPVNHGHIVHRWTEDGTQSSRQLATTPAQQREAVTRPGPATPNLLLSPSEASAALGISRSTLYLLLRSGAICSVRIGTLRRIPSSALADFVATLLPEATTRPDRS